VFNIAVGGKYLSKVTGSAWASTLVDEPTADSQFEVTVEGSGIKIHALANTATQFLGPNNANINTAVYFDKTALYTWELEEVDVPLAIYKKFPSDNAPNVAINAEVKAQFNKDITASALETVTIKDADNTPVTGVLATASGATISIAHDDFAFGKVYTVTIPASVVDGLTEPVTWLFTTEAAPTITSTSPENNASNVAVNTPVSVEFNKDFIVVDLSGITLTANSVAVEGVTATQSDASIVITHPILDYATIYTVTIPAGAVKGVDAYPWSFTTTVAPTVKSTTPADEAPNVALTTLIRVTFDKNIYAGSADLTGVTLKGPDGVDISGTKSFSGSSFSIAKATGKQLVNGTLYKVTIPANTIKGVTGEIPFSFTTIGGTAIEDVNAEKVSVYPTVSKGNLTITTSGKASVKVADISGRTLASYPSNGNLNIDLNYANGIYIIAVESNGKVSTHKVILQK
jgi:hypothetical protein